MLKAVEISLSCEGVACMTGHQKSTTRCLLVFIFYWILEFLSIFRSCGLLGSSKKTQNHTHQFWVDCERK